jgi:hypothetical protein
MSVVGRIDLPPTDGEEIREAGEYRQEVLDAFESKVGEIIGNEGAGEGWIVLSGDEHGELMWFWHGMTRGNVILALERLKMLLVSLEPPDPEYNEY